MKKSIKIILLVLLAVIVLGTVTSGLLFMPEQHPTYLLQGTLVLPDEIMKDGWLVIKNGKIISVSQQQPDMPRAKVLPTDGIIFPGLVDIHNHIGWNMIPRWDPDEYFDNRYEWRRNYDPYQPIGIAYRTMIEKHFCEVNTYSEAKALVGGTTITMGTYPRWCIEGLVRNLDRFTDFYWFDIYQDHRHVMNIIDIPSNSANAQNFLNSNRSEAVFFHLAEGIDLASRAEFEKLDGLGLLTDKTIIIHGTALVPEQFELMAERGASLAWSPRSNLELYGNTTDIAAALEAGVPIAITPDWSITGSSNMLDELKVAAEWNQTQMDGVLSDKDLFLMVTSIPAKIAGIDEFIGTIELGMRADLLIIDGNPAEPYQSLLQTEPEDVKLVVVGGVLMYGDADLITQVVSAGKYSTIEIASTSKLIRVKEFDRITHSLASAMAENGYTLAPLMEEGQPVIPATIIPKENLIIDPPTTDEITWDQAELFFGQEKTVCGEVIDSFFSADGAKTTYLYMGKPFPDIDRFSIVIFEDAREKFTAEPEIAYLGETICVTGEIVTYEGGAEIILSDPANLMLP